MADSRTIEDVKGYTLTALAHVWLTLIAFVGPGTTVTGSPRLKGAGSLVNQFVC